MKYILKISALFVSIILFAACSSTSQSRYAQLTSKSELECAPSIVRLSKAPAPTLTSGFPVEGEFDDDHCVSLSDGTRSSYDMYEFTATSASQSVEIITYIKARGLGFGGENTIAVPVVTAYQKGTKTHVHSQRTQAAWIHTFVDGSMLKSTFLLGPLVPKERYRLFLTTDNTNLGKEIPGYFSTAAAGIVVIGPLGKTKITLNQ